MANLNTRHERIEKLRRYYAETGDIEALKTLTRWWQGWPVAPRHTPPLLPAGAQRKPKPDLEIVNGPRFVWILAGHWRRMPVDETVVINDQQWVVVNTGYGTRGYSQAQIDLWQREYAAIHAGKVAA